MGNRRRWGAGIGGDVTLDEIAAMPWFADLPRDECIGWRNTGRYLVW